MIIYDVYWEGPVKVPLDKVANLQNELFTDQKIKESKDDYVLYQIYGSHHLYGRDVLLYIGKTEDIKTRVTSHKEWLKWEYDTVSFRLATIGKYDYKSWDSWDSYRGTYSKFTDGEILEQIEALQIYAHQPVYNSDHKSESDTVKNATGIHIFNTGSLGQLFPEVSHKRYSG